jgi:hypothetical protein
MMMTILVETYSEELLKWITFNEFYRTLVLHGDGKKLIDTGYIYR